MIDLHDWKPEQKNPDSEKWEIEEIALAVIGVILWTVIVTGWLGVIFG